jgi:hypothetical protein
MGRGRTSAAALSVIAVDELARPEPPEELDADEAKEWREIAAALPPTWFGRETSPILVQYCKLIVRIRGLSIKIKQLEKKKDFDVVSYNRLVQTEQTQTRLMLLLATKMRITQQSSYDKSKRKHIIGSGKKLWEAPED